MELFAEILCRLLPGNPPDSHTIEWAVGRIILLNENGGVADAQAVAQALGVAAIVERSDLHSKKARCDIHIAENFDSHRHDARANGFDFAGRGLGEVDDAIVHERAAVRDAHGSGLAVVEIRDANHGFKRQRAMSGGEFVHVVDFTVRSAAAMEWVAIPGGISFFSVADRRWRLGRFHVFRTRGNWRGSWRNRSVPPGVIDGFRRRRGRRSGRRLAGRNPRLQFSGGFGKFFGSFAKNLGGASFGGWGHFFVNKLAEASQLFLQPLANLFKFVHGSPFSPRSGTG